jgi:uncharacterized protein YdhG (YjbR/CyaY superfamily)
MNWKKYFSKIDKSRQSILLEIIEIALKYEPKAKKDMPYGVPGLKFNGKNLIAVAAHKNHYGIYPFSPQVIERVSNQLSGIETAKGTIKFHYDNFPKEELIKSLIIERRKEIS